MTTRIMVGVANLVGRKVNSLTVGQMVSRRPEPRYQTRCEICDTVGTATQRQLTTGAARCLANGCGRAHVGEHLRETGRRFRAKVEADAEAKRAAQEEQERHADRQAKKEALSERSRRLREFTRNEVANGRDEQLFVSPELRKLTLPKDEATKFNKNESDKFVASTPEYASYRSNESADAILAYLERNGVRIFDVATLRAAFLRLRDLGLIQPRPADPPDEPQVRPKQSVVNLTVAKPDDGSEQGWDESGNPITLTRRQVAALSADQYRRFKRIYADQLNSLPRTGPGPRGLNA